MSSSRLSLGNLQITESFKWLVDIGLTISVISGTLTWQDPVPVVTHVLYLPHVSPPDVVRRQARDLTFQHAKVLSRQLLGRLLRPDIVTKRILHVHKAEVPALSDLVDSRKVRIRQLDALEVGLDTGRVRALGQHDVAAAQTPRDEHLGQRVAALLGDLVERGVLADALARRRHLVLRAQRRVRLGHDVVVEAVLHQLIVGQERVHLDLVDLRRYLGVLEQLLQLLLGPVGDTDGARLLLGVELLHCAPGRFGVLGEVLEDDVLEVSYVE